MAAEEPHGEIEADPRESRYELPPIEQAPFSSEVEKKLAVCRVIAQAELERAAAAAREKRG